MTGWTCPDCGAELVCSRQEWVAVYDYRAQIQDATPRLLAEELVSYGVQPDHVDDGADICRTWAAGETDGPEYICADCVTPFAAEEVAG